MDKLNHPEMIEGMSRVEAFSDGVMAIIVTLLIFEVHVPSLTDASISGVLMALLAIAPKMISFAVSFYCGDLLGQSSSFFLACHALRLAPALVQQCLALLADDRTFYDCVYRRLSDQLGRRVHLWMKPLLGRALFYADG